MTYTDVSARRAKVLCNTAPTSMRGYCWQGIGNILGSLNREGEERKASCNQATVIKSYRISCYTGAHVTGYE
jgi:hypothetical protein